MVRDQEVGGSNPLAPTNLFNYFRVYAARLYAINGGTPASDQHLPPNPIYAKERRGSARSQIKDFLII